MTATDGAASDETANAGETGSAADMLARLKAVLPTRWFADETPVLDALLGGFATTASWAYGLLQQARSQTRLATAEGAFLDMIALDFFGVRLKRRALQGDEAFRRRIATEMLRERGTRPALEALLRDLTGRAPVVFEPARPADTGAWGAALGYGVAGGWGSLMLPFQCFVTAFRPVGEGIANVGGYGASAGGYGGGQTEYASLELAQVQITDADIAGAIAGVMPAGSIAWMRISN